VNVEPLAASPLFVLGGSLIRRGTTFSPKISLTGRTAGGLEESGSLVRSGEWPSHL